MLSLFTLQINNKAVASRFQSYQTQKIDRLMYSALLGSSIYLLTTVVYAVFTKNGPWVAVLEATIIFLLFVAFGIFRCFSKNRTDIHEYLLLSIFILSVILCTLCNTLLLPQSLAGQGIYEFRSNFGDLFYILAVLSLVRLRNVLILISPLFLLA